MKILITGGHVTPALALIDQLEGHEIVFVGRKYALESEQTLSLEYKEITKRKIKFINLQTGRINRFVSSRSLMSMLRIPLGFAEGLNFIKKEKPEAVLSFGSYLSVPIAFWAFVFGIPVYMHEQASIPGKANRFISKFAKKIFISFPESKQYFPEKKTFLTGNPVRHTILKPIKKPFLIDKDRPVIYVTGGSLGSHSINMHLKDILKNLLQKYIVIHQIGDTKQYNDYEKLIKLKKTLPEELQKHYYPKKHFYEEEIGHIYSLADLVVGRSGANTFFELIVLKKPAVFIPLPWSGEKEQEKQAKIFKEKGVGEIFYQSESSEKLLSLIESTIGNLSHYRNNFKNLESLYKKDAAYVIAREILQK